MPYTIDGKGKPILESVKAVGDSVVCGKIMRATILPNDYDIAINMEWEEHCLKLDQAWYHVSYFA